MRAALEQRCGCCRASIAQGAPMLLIMLTAASGFRRPRCPACAGEPVTADLPALVSPQVEITPMVHVASGAGTLPLDWKQAAAGREPGEDDA
jgi:hypothetical protein